MGIILLAGLVASVAATLPAHRAHANSSSAVQAVASRPHATVAQIPFLCDRPYDGLIIEYPPGSDTRYQCICKVKTDLSGYYCDWYPYPPLLLPPPRSTWINLNSRKYLDVSNVSHDNGATLHQWAYTGALNQWWDTRNNNSFGGSFFQLASANSGKCMGIIGGGTGQGAQVVQWDCYGRDHPDQYWAYVPTGAYVGDNPVWEIVNLNTGMCLGVTGGSTSIGAPVVQWACNGHPDQNWY
jgi:hypothetical protein